MTKTQMRKIKEQEVIIAWANEQLEELYVLDAKAKKRARYNANTPANVKRTTKISSLEGDVTSAEYEINEIKNMTKEEVAKLREVEKEEAIVFINLNEKRLQLLEEKTFQTVEDLKIIFPSWSEEKLEDIIRRNKQNYEDLLEKINEQKAIVSEDDEVVEVRKKVKELKTVSKKGVATAIYVAREKGDIKNNFDITIVNQHLVNGDYYDRGVHKKLATMINNFNNVNDYLNSNYQVVKKIDDSNYIIDVVTGEVK